MRAESTFSHIDHSRRCNQSSDSQLIRQATARNRSHWRSPEINERRFFGIGIGKDLICQARGEFDLKSRHDSAVIGRTRDMLTTRKNNRRTRP